MKTAAVDNETFLITRNRLFPEAVCSSYFDGETGFVVKRERFLGDKDPLLEFWKSILKSDMEIVGHNIAYDTITILSTYPELTPLIFSAYEADRITDTGVRMQLFDIASGRIQNEDTPRYYSLAELVKILLEIEMSGKEGPDIWRLRYAELLDVPLDKWPVEAYEYAKLDAEYTYRVWDVQNAVQDKIKHEHKMTYNQFCLGLITGRGMRTNAERVRKCREHFAAEKHTLEPDLISAGLLRQKPFTREQKKRIATGEKIEPIFVKSRDVAQKLIVAGCEARGVDIPYTEASQVSTDYVAAMVSGSDLMLKRAEYSTAEKMLSTYLPFLEAGTSGMITSRFNIAATGRTTSSAPRPPAVGGNLQNAPRNGGIRECFEPRPGFVYCAADFSAAEMHTLAQTCKNLLGYSVLGGLLNRGDDPHIYVAAFLLGTSYAECLALYKSGDETAAKARQDAKAANFGFPGGMGADGFRLAQIKQADKFWTFAEIDTIRNAWFRAFPEMVEYFRHCKAELGPNGRAYISVPYTGMIRCVRTFPSIANNYFQSGTAAGALSATRKVLKTAYSDEKSILYGRCFPVNFIHDEILSEIVDDDYAHDVATEKARIMGTAFNAFCPDYPTTAEPILMRIWSKKAKPTFDSNRRLIPWEPEEF